MLWILTILGTASILTSAALMFFSGELLFGLLSLLGACFLSLVIVLGRREIQLLKEQRSALDSRMIHSHKLAAIGELSAGIAHEINNPLAIIGREAELLTHLVQEGSSGKGVSWGEILESVREIARQVERCKEITQNLLSFARKMEPVFQRVDINKLVEDMVRLVEVETQGKGIEILRDYDGGLQPLYTDPPGLRQVILNLLNNARQALEGKGTITVRTRGLHGGGVQIAIEDTGCGIPRELLPRIFDPFFTTKAQGKGTGLGLSICHGIVDRLGGRIWVRSEVGLGSTFVVELPAEPKGR